MSELRVRWHLELVDFDRGARKFAGAAPLVEVGTRTPGG